MKRLISQFLGRIRELVSRLTGRARSNPARHRSYTPPTFPRHYTYVRQGRSVSQVVSDHNELIQLRSELEMLRLCGLGDSPQALAALAGIEDREITEIRDILIDACHPATESAIQQIDDDFTAVSSEMNNSVLQEEARAFRRDVADRLQGISPALASQYVASANLEDSATPDAAARKNAMTDKTKPADAQPDADALANEESVDATLDAIESDLADLTGLVDEVQRQEAEETAEQAVAEAVTESAAEATADVSPEPDAEVQAKLEPEPEPEATTPAEAADDVQPEAAKPAEAATEAQAEAAADTPDVTSETADVEDLVMAALAEAGDEVADESMDAEAAADVLAEAEAVNDAEAEALAAAAAELSELAEEVGLSTEEPEAEPEPEEPTAEVDETAAMEPEEHNAAKPSAAIDDQPTTAAEPTTAPRDLMEDMPPMSHEAPDTARTSAAAESHAFDSARPSSYARTESPRRPAPRISRSPSRTPRQGAVESAIENLGMFLLEEVNGLWTEAREALEEIVADRDHIRDVRNNIVALHDEMLRMCKDIAAARREASVVQAQIHNIRDDASRARHRAEAAATDSQSACDRAVAAAREADVVSSHGRPGI